MTAYLCSQLETAIELRQSYAVIGWLNGEPIGHCNLNPFTFGKEGKIHIHLWVKLNRRLGIGTELLRLSIEHFMLELNLKHIYAEPNCWNVGANRALEKAGFSFVKNYHTIPGSINFEQEVSQWIYKGTKN